MSMTCIVGVSDGKNVYIGADRGASDDDSIISLDTPKVYRNNNWIFGFSGSLGTGQLMQCITLPIVKDNEDVFVILRTKVVSLLKNAIDIYGTESSDHAADFLIGCKGRLFEMSTEDWGVVEVNEVSIGSGGAFALGSLYSTKHYSNTRDRIELALGSAITYSPTCQGPIDIISL